MCRHPSKMRSEHVAIFLPLYIFSFRNVALLHRRANLCKPSDSRETNVDHLRHKIADISVEYGAGVTIKTYYDENNEILYCEKCDDDLE